MMMIARWWMEARSFRGAIARVCGVMLVDWYDEQVVWEIVLKFPPILLRLNPALMIVQGNRKSLQNSSTERFIPFSGLKCDVKDINKWNYNFEI
jgi:hypothetical protein